MDKISTHKTSAEALKYRVPALEKGLDILEYLSDISVPQSQAEIARALGRNTSEIFRMLDCLEQRGYLLRDGSAKYQLSLKLYQLAHTHSLVDTLLEAARNPMRNFAKQQRESVHLSVLHEGQLLVLAEELSPNPIRISVEVGRSFPAVKTSSGKLLLAQLEQSEVEAFLEDDPHTQHASQHAQRNLHEQITELRSATSFVAKSDITVGVQDVSVLIGQASLGLSATLTVPLLMLKDRILETDKVLRALKEAATHINRNLGLEI
ncbi:MAG: IclR family transcriptional regulator C-terminal domain-containing protein [Deinococcota bacterium]